MKRNVFLFTVAAILACTGMFSFINKKTPAPVDDYFPDYIILQVNPVGMRPILHINYGQNIKEEIPLKVPVMTNAEVISHNNNILIEQLTRLKKSGYRVAGVSENRFLLEKQ